MNRNNFVITVVTCVTILAFSHAGFADGGRMIATTGTGPYRVTVFASPAAVTAGPVDISVLVQDAETNRWVGDVDVTLHAISPEPAKAPLERDATTSKSNNRMLRSAKLELQQRGVWRIEAYLNGPRGQATAVCELRVLPPRSKWRTVLPWVLLPIAAVALFALREILFAPKRAAALRSAAATRGYEST